MARSVLPEPARAGDEGRPPLGETAARDLIEALDARQCLFESIGLNRYLLLGHKLHLPCRFSEMHSVTICTVDPYSSWPIRDEATIYRIHVKNEQKRRTKDTS